MAANIATVSASNFDAEVLQSTTPVLVDFWAEWCGPCKMIAPILEELAVEFAGKIKIAKVNIDDDPELSVRYGVKAIPTLLVFQKGQVADQIVGAKPKKDLKASLEKFAV